MPLFRVKDFPYHYPSTCHADYTVAAELNSKHSYTTLRRSAREATIVSSCFALAGDGRLVWPSTTISSQIGQYRESPLSKGVCLW